MRQRFVRHFVGFGVLFVVVVASIVVAVAWLIGTIAPADVPPSPGAGMESFVDLLLRGNIASALVSGILWLVGTILSPRTMAAIPVAILILLALVAVVVVGRRIRGTAVPLGDLIDASARVEAGEVGTQVDVRGPREIRALARAFNAMSARLAADNAQRRRFLADVSHELRTPLTIIQGTVEGILDGLYPADRAQLERLLAETHQLERLTDDLRTLSLTDAGALELRREPVDLGALASDVVAAFEPQATAEGVTLAFDAEELPTLALDARRVRQVIGNLLSNALRHTPSGGRIGVRVGRVGDGVELEVADTGSGMDAASAEHAFDRFWRSGDRAGAGLGLAIVRDLVAAHGGHTSLESAPGRGTTVRCLFPLTGDAAQASAPPRMPSAVHPEFTIPAHSTAMVDASGPRNGPPTEEPTMAAIPAPAQPYPARLDVDYPERLDRLTTFLRILWVIPILIILSLVMAASDGDTAGATLFGGLWLATVLMIVVRLVYPRWWFDFARELTRFGARVGAYLALLTDRYPSTVEEQAVHLEIDYPDTRQDLNRWLPLVKWILAIPHYVILVFLFIGAFVAIIVAWFAILITGRYPQPLFDYVVGVGRWSLRVGAYAFLLVTDKYPPFSLR
jgi:signal transduction histidine kinase